MKEWVDAEGNKTTNSTRKLTDVFLAILSLFVASLQAKLNLEKALSKVSVCFNV